MRWSEEYGRLIDLATPAMLWWNEGMPQARPLASCLSRLVLRVLWLLSPKEVTWIAAHRLRIHYEFSSGSPHERR